MQSVCVFVFSGWTPGPQEPGTGLPHDAHATFATESLKWKSAKAVTEREKQTPPAKQAAPSPSFIGDRSKWQVEKTAQKREVLNFPRLPPAVLPCFVPRLGRETQTATFKPK